MEYGGKNPNGINQVSQSLLSIDVQGVEQVNISTSSVDINTSLYVENNITASNISGSYTGDGSELFNIPPEALTQDAQNKIFDGTVTASISEVDGFVVNTSASFTGDILATGEISGAFISGDGSGLFNVPAEALGDIDRIKSGSAQAVISPNNGLVVDATTTINGDLTVTGSATVNVDATIDRDLSVGRDLSVAGRITSQELLTTFISSSVIYASGSNVFGDESSDTHQFTGSVLIKDSVVIPVLVQNLLVDKSDNYIIIQLIPIYSDTHLLDGNLQLVLLVLLVHLGQVVHQEVVVVLEHLVLVVLLV